jgi:hypothetical protein
MSYDDFLTLLKKAGLTPNEFASKTGLTNAAVLVWSREKEVRTSWVGSWLELFVENNKLKSKIEFLREEIKDIINDKHKNEVVQSGSNLEIWLTVGKDTIATGDRAIRPIKMKINDTLYSIKTWKDILPQIVSCVVRESISDIDSLQKLDIFKQTNCHLYTGVQKEKTDRSITDNLHIRTGLSADDIMARVKSLSKDFGIEISLVLNK